MCLFRMICLFRRFVHVLWLLSILCANAFAQSDLIRSTKTLTVYDGLPQSYTSGIQQDQQGFMWIATRDGLARYDGRKFKIFRHDRNRSSSLAGNIITHFYLDKADQLLIAYESGELDILHTETEQVTHLSALPDYAIVKDKLKEGNSMLADYLGRYWLIDKNGGLLIVDLHQKQARHYTLKSLFPALGEQHITGITAKGEQMLLVLERSMIYVDQHFRIVEHIPFTFPQAQLYDAQTSWKDNSPIIRSNGDILIPDDKRLILYQKDNSSFKVFPLPPQKYYMSAHFVQDTDGNVIIAYERYIYRLNKQNQLQLWNPEMTQDPFTKTAIYLDRSGILWAGTGGYGIKLYDTYLNQMPNLPYHPIFPTAVLQTLGIAEKTIQKTFLYRINPYFFRWASGKDGKIWMTRSGADQVSSPHLLAYQNGTIRQPHYTYENRSPQPNVGLDALAISPAGKLWAIDHFFRPVYFDTLRHIATVYPEVPHHFPPGKFNEINGMIMDGEYNFWICTSLGLIQYNSKTSLLKHYFLKNPALHLLCVQQDAHQPNILWLGSYADGLIRFDKNTGHYRFFTTANGLPNNTVYAILPDRTGLFWCSTNNGLFSFDPESHAVNRFTPQGRASLVEFNRFHFFAFPNGKLAFGGTDGYTLFLPKAIKDDSFEPEVALTGIQINNHPADYVPGRSRNTTFHLAQPLHRLSHLELSYQQNFLSFEFAALQFNMPEKLQYRYKLMGLNDDWVLVGNKNTATYTTIPPGHYTLLINASNTSGKWSHHVRKLAITIRPPFWVTWWFRLGGLLLLSGTIFLLIKKRLQVVRKKDQEKMAFERETMELEAQALRSQMNPHFIFNCLNSIKALIQEGEKKKAVIYLTTFSKLIRNQLNNNLQEITLQEELDTCQRYLQMEALRFGEKISYSYDMDPAVDPSQIRVPPLLIQPFVENAVIHGILPLEGNGQILLKIQTYGQDVVCLIDDNGIGRQQSALLKLNRKSTHRSKGTLLVEQRLKLHNTLSRYNISIAVQDKTDHHHQPAGTRVTLTFKSCVS